MDVSSLVYLMGGEEPQSSGSNSTIQNMQPFVLYPSFMSVHCLCVLISFS